MTDQEATRVVILLFAGSILFTLILLAVLWCIPKTRSAMKKSEEEWRRLSYKRNKNRYIEDVDKMSGDEFERFSVRLLEAVGFGLVEKTKTSGDYGIDVVARKDGKKYAFQCKCYQGSVGVHAVQEAFSGAKMYRADVAAVITNSRFTPNAQKMAKEIGVQLFDRKLLIKLMNKAELGDGIS